MHSSEGQLVQLSHGNNAIERFAALSQSFETGPPEEVIRWAFEEYGERLTMATGFGAEGMVLLDIAVKVIPQPHVFFLDTGFLFPETYELRKRIERRYGIIIQAYKTALTPEQQETLYGPQLWQQNPDLCCKLRKVEPLKEALQGKSAWMTAIRRDQTAARAHAGIIEWDERWNLVKVNPLARWSKKDVWRHIVRNDVPYNPLHDVGYPSVGCTHCTRAIATGEEERAGRWANQVKTECGLHAVTTAG